MADKRVCFDFDVEFENGGGIQGQGFRLDIDGDDIADDALAAYIIRDLRLLMVAEFLRKEGAVLVGIDSLNIDDLGDKKRPVHSILLGADIPIVEHLTGLEQLPNQEFFFSAVPPKIIGMGTFPVRAHASWRTSADQ